MYEIFLAHDALNNDTSNNINNEITKYMNNTKMILQRSKRKKRGLENEPIRGESKISHVYLYINPVRLIERTLDKVCTFNVINQCFYIIVSI